ncbi:hypothetical protein GLOTRDRAFT_110604 [Gloeophyllum trabeum ATCC 11539]|uniref:Uncharacterized protein n=1 Tax=Gloeophyllum trabeum (strain ATCC 11539 / FP-39264 / Madison 617) TaxID=670483 RepID=S7QDS6_GLOTA|nr:uncharacterized protein GLOTRDRAFT_110604 [Gloeophyllum trabeum ATCC 11539]EPQ57502.1 hypothetical protein GLOTRDRAFT_110604 [Gloeophyllum trabeum ATCC 11539]
MSEANSIPPTPAAAPDGADGADYTSGRLHPDRRISSGKPPPPPKPLDLPEPRAPPPRSGTPVANRPPEPIPSPVPVPVEQEEDEPPTRWWTDWLCGCREGGEHQAARTNPME